MDIYPLKNLKAPSSIALPIIDNSDIGAARRAAVSLANKLNFSDMEINKIALIVTELASNLIKHATLDAQLVVQSIESPNNPYFEILALDKGPGMDNVKQSLADGYSTTNTSGTGLGAVYRLADLVDIYSQKNRGTVVLARVLVKAAKKILSPLDIGCISIPYPGEQLCGDSWSIYQTDKRSVFLVADGLGHGFDAAEASQEACEIFQQNNQLGPAQLVSIISENLRKTRGAAIAIAEINIKKQTVTFAGLGNISGNIHTNNNNCHMVSHDGTAGINQFTVRDFIYPWRPHSILVLHSDGITTRWDLSQDNLGLPLRSATIIASILYRDFRRNNDDVTVVVAKG